MVFLSVLALLAVLSGYTEPPQRDEGTAAHIFQLSIVALIPMIILFIATADWRRHWRSARPLALSAAALILAFGALYYLEHYRDPNYVGRTREPGPNGRIRSLGLSAAASWISSSTPIRSAIGDSA